MVITIIFSGKLFREIFELRGPVKIFELHLPMERKLIEINLWNKTFKKLLRTNKGNYEEKTKYTT